MTFYVVVTVDWSVGIFGWGHVPFLGGKLLDGKSNFIPTTFCKIVLNPWIFFSGKGIRKTYIMVMLKIIPKIY